MLRPQAPVVDPLVTETDPPLLALSDSVHCEAAKVATIDRLLFKTNVYGLVTDKLVDTSVKPANPKFAFGVACMVTLRPQFPVALPLEMLAVPPAVALNVNVHCNAAKVGVRILSLLIVNV